MLGADELQYGGGAGGRKGLSLWATQAKALQDGAWKMTYFVTSLHLAARHSTGPQPCVLSLTEGGTYG